MKRAAKDNLRIALVASAGGHLSQLLKLEAAWQERDVFYVTTQNLAGPNWGAARTYAVGECNRQTPWRTLRVALRCLRIVLRERPDVVISTGAAVGCLSCLFGKVLGARVIWLDSITNVERLSLAGRIVRPLADLFLVQWPDLAARFKRVEYIGSVI